MRSVTVTVGPLASASANNICLSQTPSSTFTLNGAAVSGGVATLDTPRRVLFTQAAAETGKTYTIVGTTWGSVAQTEVLSAASSATTVQSNLDFLTVTSITISAGASGAITVGTNGVASSPWVSLSDYGAGQSTALQCTVTGTVNYTVQETMQDPNSPTNPVLPYNVSWVSSSDTNVVGATTTQGSVAGSLVKWVRVLLNSGTGSVSTVVSQADFGGGGGGSGGGAGTTTVTATASATPTPVVAGPNKPLNEGLFSDLFVTITDGAGNLVNQSATVNVGPDTSVIFNGSTSLVPKFAAIAVSSSGANQILPPVTSKKIRVVSFTLVASAAVNAKWQSAANDLTGLLYLATNGGVSSAYAPTGLFQTNATEALNLNLSGAVPVGGFLTYVEV